MGDYDYLCDLFDVSPTQAHQLADIALAEDAREQMAEQDSILLGAG